MADNDEFPPDQPPGEPPPAPETNEFQTRLDALSAELATLRDELNARIDAIGEHEHAGYAAIEHQHTGPDAEPEPEPEPEPTPDNRPESGHFWFKRIE
jgi:translation initiation factor IF-2